MLPIRLNPAKRALSISCQIDMEQTLQKRASVAADEPLAQQGDTRLNLLGRGLGDLGAPAARAQA